MEIRIAGQASDVKYASAFKKERSFLRKQQRKACQVDLTDVGLGLGEVRVDGDRGIQVRRQVLEDIETMCRVGGILATDNSPARSHI